jgi:hypothetical protein
MKKLKKFLKVFVSALLVIFMVPFLILGFMTGLIVASTHLGYKQTYVIMDKLSK